jgi:hypothetical protein
MSVGKIATYICWTVSVSVELNWQMSGSNWQLFYLLIVDYLNILAASNRISERERLALITKRLKHQTVKVLICTANWTAGRSLLLERYPELVRLSLW